LKSANLKLVLTAIGISIVTLVSCAQEKNSTSNLKFTVSPCFSCGLGLDNIGLQGHEQLVRFAKPKANSNLEKQRISFRFDISMDDSEKSQTIAGLQSKDPLVIGNYATDRPDSTTVISMRNFVKVFLGLEGELDWHNDGRIQFFHFLRNFDSQGIPTSAKSACSRSVSYISEYAPLYAAGYSQSLRANDLRGKNANLAGLGHLTHVIQDAFSKAHVKRDVANPRKILDVCTYGIENPSACFHGLRAHDDVAGINADIPWKEGFSLISSAGKTDRSDLKPEAELATRATESFLTAAGILIDFYDASLNDPFGDANFMLYSSTILSTFFLGEKAPLGDHTRLGPEGTGFFRCDEISK
jgi:hypothetical protein